MNENNQNTSEIDIKNILSKIIFYKVAIGIISILAILSSLIFYTLQEKIFTYKYEIKPLESLSLYFTNSVSETFINNDSSISEFFLEIFYDKHFANFKTTINSSKLSNDEVDLILKSSDSGYDEDTGGYIIQFDSLISKDQGTQIILDTITKTNQELHNNILNALNRILESKNNIIQKTKNINGESLEVLNLDIEVLKSTERANLQKSLTVLEENLEIAQLLDIRSSFTVDSDGSKLFYEESTRKIIPDETLLSAREDEEGRYILKEVDTKNIKSYAGAYKSSQELGVPSFLSGIEIITIEIERIKLIIENDDIRGIGNDMDYLISKKALLMEDTQLIDTINEKRIYKSPSSITTYLESVMITEETKSIMKLLEKDELTEFVGFNSNELRLIPNFLSIFNCLMLGLTIGVLLSFVYIIIKELSVR